jgi:heme-degrading monooxygenase HmoA
VGEVYTTGSWRPFAGQEEAFLEEWKAFMDWACSLPGAGHAVLARDLRDPERFVSVAVWDSLEAVQTWKVSLEFKPRMSRVQAHVDKFAPTELEVVSVAGE